MGLDRLVDKMPAGGNRLRLGVVTTVDGERLVNVDGNNLRPHSWADPLVVDDGDPVEVQISSSGVGGGRVHVSGRSTLQPRHKTGKVTVVPPGSPTISVSAGGVTYAAEPVGGPYAVGDTVHLDWGAGSARAIGKVTLTAVPRPPVVAAPPKPPPPKPVRGKTSAAARLSRTRGPYGWGTHAGDGGHVYQGSWGGVVTTGAWFYGTPFRALAGRKITRIQFRTGQHLGAGASGAKDFHFYAHNHPSQPANDTVRVVGPFNYTIRAGAAPMWIDLPLSFAATLVAGGGIAIAGEPYALMQGRTSNSPDSGSLILHWER